ncbi:MAG: hypothetical protein PHN55_08850 [Dysgonamonadaceae bacterium]|nr:hypothetical protein [Dysgonamonadaceae bacterium]
MGKATRVKAKKARTTEQFNLVQRLQNSLDRSLRKIGENSNFQKRSNLTNAYNNAFIGKSQEMEPAPVQAKRIDLDEFFTKAQKNAMAGIRGNSKVQFLPQKEANKKKFLPQKEC